MQPDDARDRVAASASEFGIELDAPQIDRLLCHLELLQKWNKVYNLTAVRDPAAMLQQHLLDSLALVAPLQQHFKTHPGTRLLDVGSGAGFPGMTVATALPEVEVICVDSVGKKMGFVRQVIGELGLSNARAEHARIESLAPLGCDVITSRAFASLADFVTWTRQHLAPGGVWVAMKGQQPDTEIHALPADIEVFHVEQLHVPGLGAERCLVWMRLAH